MSLILRWLRILKKFTFCINQTTTLPGAKSSEWKINNCIFKKIFPYWDCVWLCHRVISSFMKIIYNRLLPVLNQRFTVSEIELNKSTWINQCISIGLKMIACKKMTKVSLRDTPLFLLLPFYSLSSLIRTWKQW